jgi:hypothetical protein
MIVQELVLIVGNLTTNFFNASTGVYVHQADSLSTPLFNTFLNSVIKKTRFKCDTSSKIEQRFAYADNMGLIDRTDSAYCTF